MKNLFVSNMSFQTTESDLTALFKGFGQQAFSIRQLRRSGRI
jgi:RNA recognition motif-containing protein